MSPAVREGIPSEVSVGAETTELRIHGATATISQRFDRLGPHGWTTELVATAEGTARPSADGWLLDFEWRDRVARRSARLSCAPVTTRVHAPDAQPAGLCTIASR